MVEYHSEAIPIKFFDPEGYDYDYQTSIDAGNEPDDTKHWVSLDPRTGMVLKGRNHPTWDLMVEDETKLGNTVIKADDGRYYSLNLPRYLSEAKPLQESGLEDTIDNWEQRAQRDYDFAINNNVPLDGIDAIKREWATPSGLVHKIPFAGGMLAFYENIDLINAAKRLQNNFDYSKPIMEEGIQPFTQEAYRTVRPAVYTNLENDQKLVSDYLKYISTEKTWMNRVTTGASQLPTWFLEFAATGGLASLGDDVARKTGEKLLGEYAKSTAGKLAIKTAGWVSGSVIRGSAGLGHKVLEGMSQRQVDVIMGMREEEGWAMSALISWGGVVITASTESFTGKGALGSEILSALPFGSKLSSAMESAWMTVTKGKQGEFARNFLSKGGYSNFLSEIGEERLETILRAITGVDDFGLGKDASMIDRLKAGILQDWENIGVELGVLAIPAGGQIALSHLTSVKPDFTYKFDQTESQEPAPSVETVQKITQPELVETKPQEIPQKPVTIDKANTHREVSDVVQQIVTQGVDPTILGLKQEDLQAARKSLGLDGIASKVRQSRLQAFQQAKEQNIIARALSLAAEANAGVRKLNIPEKAGLLMKAVQLEYQHKQLSRQLAEATDEAVIHDIGIKQDIIVNEFNTISSALYEAGSEAGRILAFQKVVINQDFDILSLKAQFKKKKGKDLTEKENAKIEQQAKDLELLQQKYDLLQKQVSEKMVKEFVKEGSVRRYSRMSQAQRNLELDSLINRTQQLLEEGCLN